MKRRRIQLTFAKRLTLTMIAILLLASLLISAASYILASKNMNAMQMNLISKSAEKISETIQSTITGVDQYLTLILQTSDIRAIAETNMLSDYSIYNFREYLKNTLYLDSFTRNTPISFVNYYLKNGTVITTSGSGLPFDSYDTWMNYLISKQAVSADDYTGEIWFGVYTISGSESSGTSNYVCVRFLYHHTTMEKVGLYITGIRETDLSACYASVFPDAFIMQNSGSIVSSTNKSKIGQTYPSEDLISSLNQQIDSSGEVQYSEQGVIKNALYWKIANNNAFFIVPIEDAFFQTDLAANFTWQIIVIVAAAILLSVVISVFSSNNLSKSILSLKKVVQKVYNGDLSARYVPRHDDEIAYLGTQFNDMLEQIEDFFKTQERDAAERRNLEIRLLQSQVKPHLLYNTLESAAWAIKNNNNAKAEILINSLSKFFRYILSKGQEWITLEEEVDILRNYIDIQNLSGDKEFKLKIDIPPELLSYKIQRMTLQPILENSILHGFFGYRDDGEVDIRTELYPSENILVIIVRDNGIGVEEKTLEEIRLSIIKKDIEEGQKHFGLYSIHRRIQNRYGEKYGLAIASEITEYTEVTITLPYKR